MEIMETHPRNDPCVTDAHVTIVLFIVTVAEGFIREFVTTFAPPSSYVFNASHGIRWTRYRSTVANL